MRIHQFEEIIAWQKAQDLSFDIYQAFKNVRDFSFKDQICRASVSISNNIAEGFDRNSDRQFQYFLFVAFSSTSEVRSMLYLAARLSYIDEATKQLLIAQSRDVSRLISAFIKALKNKNSIPSQPQK